MKEISRTRMILLFAAFMMAFDNFALYRNILEVYTLQASNILFLVSLIVVFSCGIVFLMSLMSYRMTIKPLIITILLLSSVTCYFMVTYNIVIDDVMIANTLQTDHAEAGDLMNIKFFLYLFFLGILPSIYVYKIKIKKVSFRRELMSNAKLAGGSLFIALAMIMIFSNFYASFFREHKIVRYYSNPTYYLYSSVNYISGLFRNANVELKKVALDAFKGNKTAERKLVVLVVGETARSDRFSLNGYNRETNPRLKKEKINSYNNVWSCGTSTSISVPCMFSMYGRDDYSTRKAKSTENVLDILQRTGVNVLWLDNNTGSKGVAERVTFENYHNNKNNPACDLECRDIGMITRLHSYIQTHKEGDIFIVMHQMGNHGPAYYKRYPKKFEKFKPVCTTNQLEKCSQQEINNSYDNAILYTDYFLSNVIQELKKYRNDFDSSMIYISDHGESLGENGLYLHGLPYMFAPDVQKKVPLITWFSTNTLQNTTAEYTHDNIFHTVLGLLDIKTHVYKSELDILKRGQVLISKY